MIFDSNISSARKQLCNIGPLVPKLLLGLVNGAFFLLGPWSFVDGRVKVVQPPCPALFPRALRPCQFHLRKRALQLRSNASSDLFDKLHDDNVLLCSPSTPFMCSRHRQVLQGRLLRFSFCVARGQIFRVGKFSRHWGQARV